MSFNGRGFASAAAIGLGAFLLFLGVWTVASAEWADWQHATQPPAGPHEALPARLDAPPTDPPEAGMDGPAPAPAAVRPGAALAGDISSLSAAPAPASPGSSAAPAAGDPSASGDAPAALAPPPLPTAGPYHPPRGAAPGDPLATAPEVYHPPRSADPGGAASSSRAVGPIGVDDGADSRPSAADSAEPRSAPAPTPRAVPGAAPPDARSYGPAQWMAIPRLRVDSAVTDVGVHDGAYDVPLWDVGHHADSRNPGEPGNSVFNGHLETLHAGKVFARLAELTPGDAIYVYTPGYLLAWRVETVASVPNDDTGFVQPTADRRITLYTCTGRWDPLAHDYTERFVVVARLVIVSPRA